MSHEGKMRRGEEYSHTDKSKLNKGQLEELDFYMGQAQADFVKNEVKTEPSYNELKEIAKKAGLEFKNNIKKIDLIALIEAAKK